MKLIKLPKIVSWKCLFKCCLLVLVAIFLLTHCGPVTPYSNIEIWLILVQVMPYCLTAPGHYLNQCWLIITEEFWYLPEGNFTGNAQVRSFKINDLTLQPDPKGQWVHSLWPSDARCRQRSGSTLAQVMACCLTAPSHYLNQHWQIIREVLWHSC